MEKEKIVTAILRNHSLAWVNNKVVTLPVIKKEHPYELRKMLAEMFAERLTNNSKDMDFISKDSVNLLKRAIVITTEHENGIITSEEFAKRMQQVKDDAIKFGVTINQTQKSND